MHEDQTNLPDIRHSSSQKSAFESGVFEQNPCSDPNTCTLEAFTTQLDYLRWRHEPEDEVSINSQPLFEYETQAAKRKRKTRKAKKKEAEEDPSYFDEGTCAHDKCLQFLVRTRHVAESREAYAWAITSMLLRDQVSRSC